MIGIGTSAEATLTVRMDDTAEALSLGPQDSFPPVFATSRMVALMEIAAARLLAPQLSVGQCSVGASIDVRHNAATSAYEEVRAVATLRSFDGKLYHYEVEAFDAGGSIGKGEHARAIVQTDRLLSGAARRRAQPGRL